MLTRLGFCSALVVVLVALVAAPASAGGWAVTTLDALPAGGFEAGQTYDIGFTIRQHGVSPFNQATPRIRASLGDTYLSFGATRDGNGHYVARVQFPAEGSWTWVVDQAPFATQELGTLTVRPAAPAALTEPQLAAGSIAQAVLGYALAGLLALVVLLWRRPLVLRRIR
ncbi:MAG TPA: hypothetical protein VFG86_20505 [Chloroflexota bacterium]|jgi:hypothetical protein|nr:hypothetical protein [Chloroflexota bacterium]